VGEGKFTLSFVGRCPSRKGKLRREEKKKKKKGFPMLACSLARLLGNENKTRRLTTREPHARKKSLLFGREEEKDTTFLSWAAPHQ